MRKDAGLVLEGGANRGIFTAGAVDYLMEQNCYFPYVAGVSAGACNAVDYVSRQIGRTRDCILPDSEHPYFDLKKSLKTKQIFDMDMIFMEYPFKEHPFDFDTYRNSEMECELVVTNCRTGRAEYLDERECFEDLMTLVKASSSIPLASPIVPFRGEEYVDGGIADSVPIAHALRKGYKKCVVILTRRKGYRKKEKPLMLPIYRKQLKEYPELVKALYYRPDHYNKTMDLIDSLEEKGHIFVLRPERKEVSRTEQNKEALNQFYEHGYEQMKAHYDALMDYLGHA